LRVIGFLSGLFVAGVQSNRIVEIVVRLALARDNDGRAGPAASVSVMPSSETLKVVDRASSNFRRLVHRFHERTMN